MQLNTTNFGEESKVLGDVRQTTEFTISYTSKAVVIDSLINLYEDPTGSIVREITSNCVDAHRERDLKLSGKRPLEEDDDVKFFSTKNIIEIEYLNQNRDLGIGAAFIFRDFGVGLSQKRVQSIFTVFGSSTKRDDNFEIGGFGLGSKSPFAYTDTFYVRTKRNGAEYVYLLSRGESVPTMDLVFVKDTKDLNGTEIIIPLKLSHHAKDFITAINRQLTYFPQLLYKNTDTIGYIKKPKVKFENEDFLIDEETSNPGILIGTVEYPINISLLAVGNVPSIGIKYKFGIGELDLVPSRESVRYTEKTKKLLVAKINAAQTFAKKQVATVMNAEKDFLKKIQMYMCVGRGYHSNLDEKIISGDVILFKSFVKIAGESYHNTSFEFEKLKIPYSRMEDGYLFRSFTVTEIYKQSDNKIRRDVNAYPSILGCNTFYIKEKDEQFNRKKDLAIIKTLLAANKGYGFYMLEDNPENVTKEKLESYIGKHNYSAEMPKEQVLLNEYLRKYIKPELYKDVDTSIIDEEDDDSDGAYETPEQARKKAGKIFYRTCSKNNSYYYRRNNAQYVWTNYEQKATDIDYKNLVYGFEADKEKLELARYIMDALGKSTLSFVRIAKTVKKLFNESTHIDDFFDKASNIIKSAFTSNYVISALSSYKHYKNFKDIDQDVYNLYVKLEKLTKPEVNFTKDQRDAILKYCDCKDIDLIDKTVLDDIKTLTEYNKDLGLLAFVGNLYSGYAPDPKLIACVKEYLTLKGKLIAKTEETT